MVVPSYVLCTSERHVATFAKDDESSHSTNWIENGH